MLSNKKPYVFQDSFTIDSPALIVFHEVVKTNIDNALQLIAGSKNTLLRPHIKTVKCQEAIQLAMSRGIDRFKCSTISEAELLGMTGAKDVLLCYQLSETKAKRFSNLRDKYPNTKFSALVDNLDSAVMLSNFFDERPLPVFIDINVGMNRTGIKIDKVVEFITKIKDLKGFQINGLHAYDGHVHASELEIRKQQTEEIFSALSNLLNLTDVILGEKLALVIGGSPSFTFYAKKDGVECSPGTFFFWDAGYGSSFSELPFIPAATILTRVVSIIDKNTLCFDLGTKATASDPPQPRVDILNLEGYSIIDQFEEHLVVSVPDTSQYTIGEPFLAIPYHICPTVNLYEELMVIEDGIVSDTWEVLARNRKITV